jgi:O-antigen biosynthesis protein
MPFNLLDHSVYLSPPQRVAVSSWKQHVPFGMLLIDLLRPRLVVELGAHAGVSYCAFCQAVTELRLDTRCVAIDSWEGDSQAGAYGPDILADLRAYHDARYAAFSTLKQSYFDDAVADFADGSIDLLHIDGFHTYEAVKHDLETWLPKLSAQGVIMLHDIAEHSPTFGVWRLWDELKRVYPRHLEFEHGHGLGVVAVGESAPAELQAVFDLPPAQWATLRDLMRDLGMRFDERVNAETERLEAAREREASAIHIRNLDATLQREQRQAAVTIEAHEQQLAETQRRLDNALWQLAWLNQSRGVRMVKLARASRALLRQRGPLWLGRRIALWTLGKRGYYRLDSAAALPTPKQARPVAREHKQVMFLSGCPGGAMRYRCDHQAEQLNLLGCSAESAAISTVNLMDLLDRFQCFVLHRVPYDADVQQFMAEARKRGKPVFFETDDLVFMPDGANNAKHQAELERFSPQDRALYIEEMGRIRQTLLLCESATVSTQPLREWIAPLCARVAITPNVVSQEMIARSQMALASHAANAGDAVVIAYLSGSPSHDRDFLEAQDAILWALETYPQVSLLVAGPLTLSDQFDRFGARVRREPLRPWQALPALYATISINLAPLERDNPFTEAKSSIKFLEAALLNVPTIASARSDFKRVMRDGENGLLADTPDAWRAALRRLIESPEERRQMGARAYEDVMRLHTTPAQAPTVFDTLRDHYRAVAPPSDARRLRINWVVDAPDGEQPPPEHLGLAQGLAERGHTVRVCVGGERLDEAVLARWRAAAPAVEIVAGDDALPAADASIATSDAAARVVAQGHESLFRFLLVMDGSAGTTGADPTTALPLRRISLNAADGQPDATSANAEWLAQTLSDHCW